MAAWRSQCARATDTVNLRPRACRPGSSYILGLALHEAGSSVYLSHTFIVYVSM